MAGNILFREQVQDIECPAAHDGAVVFQHWQGEIYRRRIAIELKEFQSDQTRQSELIGGQWSGFD